LIALDRSVLLQSEDELQVVCLIVRVGFSLNASTAAIPEITERT
jgi:hypothetical protein